jgi:hypothetical protein
MVEDRNYIDQFTLLTHWVDFDRVKRRQLNAMRKHRSIDSELIYFHEIGLNVEQGVPVRDKLQVGVSQLKVDIDRIYDVSFGSYQYLLSKIQYYGLSRVIFEKHLLFQGFLDIVDFIGLVLPNCLA